MTSIKPQVLTNSDGEKVAIVLPIEEYEKLVDALEELEDIKDYDLFVENPQSSPFKDVLKEPSISKSDSEILLTKPLKAMA